MRSSHLLRLLSMTALLAAACGDDGAKVVTDTADAADTGGGDSADSATPEDTGGDDVTAGDTTDADDADVGDGDTSDTSDTSAPPSLAIARAWSADGAAIHVRFSAAITPPVAGDFAVTPDGGGEALTLGSVAHDGADVLLTLVTPLEAGTTYVVTATGVSGAGGLTTPAAGATAPVLARIALNMVWHQHQPSYLDPGRDELQGPWVRKHATKDYFDMTAILRAYPEIHLNVNLTSSLLTQLALYAERLGPYVDVAADSVDEAAFLAAYAGHTDPWIDLLLRDTPTPAAASAEVKGRLYGDVWSARSVAEPLRAHFPEYEALVLKDAATYTQLDLAALKVWFELAWMDPDFLRGPVTVYEDGGADVVVDLSDVVVEDESGHFRLAARYTDAARPEADRLASLEALANRLVAENYKIIKGVFEVHKELLWKGTSGQVEVLTTPFFHPILPLLFDTDLAAEGQPADPLPSPPFAYPEDVATQLALAVTFYARTFGQAPTGMWPSEGAVAEEIVPAFVAAGISWIATDRAVLVRRMPDATHLVPYMVDADTVVGDGGSTDDELMIVFRDTDLSDKVGFFYQSNPPEENAADFVATVLAKAPRWGEPERLLSVILDGENAWEWYTRDHDGKRFQHLLYEGLTAAYDEGAIVTVTGAEYIRGTAARGLAAHPIAAMPEYEDLFPGSWIGGRLDTWIGEVEENIAWNYLRTARADLEAARGLLAPSLGSPAAELDPPATGAAARAWWSAWRAMLSAEGSDWFWWYGTDQTSAGGDDSPFDELYRAQLRAVYAFMNEALTLSSLPEVPVPAFPPILQPAPVPMTGPFGTLPLLDGALVPDESEWVPPGGVFYDNDSVGASRDPNDDITRVFYGYNKLESGRIFLGVELSEVLADKLGTDYQLVVYTSHGNLTEGASGPELTADPFNATTREGVSVAFGSGGPARRLAFDFSGAEVVATLEEADGSGGWTAVDAPGVQVGALPPLGTLLELRFLLTDLGMKNGDPLELAVFAVEGGVVVDEAPNLGTQIVFADPTKLVTVTFEVDATGAQIPLSTYSSIQAPPPPAGDGAVSIVGNQDAFGNWTPNSVFMADDGVGPDVTAGDNLWTAQFVFVPGADLQYKYTIGHSGESWGGTEEYPLTNRGFTVPSDGTRRLRIRDVFADRPEPSGSMASKTTVTVEE